MSDIERVIERRPELPPLRMSNHLGICSIDGVVLLRQYALEDAKKAFELIDRNREYLSQFGDETASKYPVLELFEESIRNPKNPNRLRFGIWNAEGILVGSINLTPDVDDAQKGEIGYYLGKEFQGNGYMRRAVETLMNYAFNVLNYRELYGKVVKGNIASENVFVKLGYVKSEEVDDKVIYTKRYEKCV